jgi:heat shock protein HslJ
MKRLIFLCISLLLLFSCNSVSTAGNSKNDASVLENTSWRLTDISGEKIPPKPENERFGNFTLNIGTDSINGYSGINSFFGSYTVTNGVITTKGIAGTLMAGPENLMKLEGRYIKALNNIKSYKIINDTLKIESDTDTLTFQKIK